MAPSEVMSLFLDPKSYPAEYSPPCEEFVEERNLTQIIADKIEN